MDEEMTQGEILEKFAMYGYKEGIIQGFILGRQKQPRPEDVVNMERLIEVTQGKLMKDLKGL